MRTINSIKNISTGILLQLIVVILGFISRKIFINTLGIQLLGINGLLTNILSMLGLVELGIGTAIYYSLYRPLAEKNKGQISAIMNLYGRMYRYIGILVILLGLIILPFLQYVINTDIQMSYVRVIFIIFLLDSSISYFLAYRRNIFSADQKDHILNKISIIFSVITSISQIVIILITRNYLIYLLVKIVLVFIQNIYIYIKSNKEYPYLKIKNEKIDESIRKEIIKNIKALCVVKLSVYCVLGTDNILLSIFSGVGIVGLYSNYYLIIGTVTRIIQQVFIGIKASFGNFLIRKTKEEVNEIFNVFHFTNFWIASFSATALIVLINPFISLWIGEEMTLPINLVIVIIFNFYNQIMTNAIEVVRDSAGLYSPYPFFKYWALIEGILNLIISILLAKVLKMGAIGIFLGTSISTCITVYVLPWNVYKYVFKISSVKYYINHFVYMGLAFMISISTYYLANLITLDHFILEFLYKMIISIVLPNIVIILLFYRSKQFKYLYKKFMSLRRNKI